MAKDYYVLGGGTGGKHNILHTYGYINLHQYTLSRAKTFHTSNKLLAVNSQPYSTSSSPILPYLHETFPILLLRHVSSAQRPCLAQNFPPDAVK